MVRLTIYRLFTPDVLQMFCLQGALFVYIISRRHATAEGLGRSTIPTKDILN